MLRFAYPLALLASTSAAEAFELSLPVACEPGETCLVQNLVDADPGPGRRDAFCGAATYDGHKGTDFRVVDLPAMREGVDVLAPAPGTVTAVRDGERDGLEDAVAVAGRECGNGLVIDHGDGWETQLCHLARDSIRVARGARVERGEAVGRMGLSGRTEFPHVHLSVRKDGRVIDPASGRAVEAANVSACASDGSDASLWDARAREAVRGDRTRILATGFASAPVTGRDVLRGVSAPGASGPLVLYAHFMNLEPGDRVDLVIVGPGGVFAQSSGEPIPSHKATWTAYAGRRTVPPGDYEGTARLYRDDRVIAERKATFTR